MSAPADAVRELVERVAAGLELAGPVEVVETEEEIVATLHGEDLGLFIGRHGSTIDAVQHLAQRVAHKAGSTGVRIVVDAEGYRERRRNALERQADRAAHDALRTRQAVALDAMTASERKLVHEYLRDRGDVETYSEGDEPDRHLVVAPAGNATT
ncbi:MAG: KH domain-containing protein [Solirubrobacteraceae bacterium]|nr:KH domain-containing protein [Solirubrobacteraceae bacterium]